MIHGAFSAVAVVLTGVVALWSIVTGLSTVPVTPVDLARASATRPVNILLVPGHDAESPGAAFRDAREEDLTFLLTKYLKEYLERDARFAVTTTRDVTSGAYTDTFKAYFIDERDAISQFREHLKTLTWAMKRTGTIEVHDGVPHNDATESMAFRLYGINKWANEHAIDAAIHVHFNDTPRKQRSVPGEYRGFVVYVPHRDYPNAPTSRAIAGPIAHRLSSVMPESNIPKESGGVVEDQDLIAVGANGSRTGASALIEYGYIYETQFRNAEVRDAALREYAYQTYLGLSDFFASRESVITDMVVADNATLPYLWTRALAEGANGKDVFALQLTLGRRGFYPPLGETLFSCPINGLFGPCTKRAVIAFQEANKETILIPSGFTAPTGIVGLATIRELNAIDE